MKPNQNEQHPLEALSHADLSVDEKAHLWQGIEARLSPQPQRSWWAEVSTVMTKQRHLSKTAKLAIVAVLLLGVSGTAAASNQAKPGDLLFGIDRAIEQAQLALASEDKAPEIRLRHAEERLTEIQALVAEAQAELEDADNSTEASPDETEATNSASTTPTDTITDAPEAGESDEASSDDETQRPAASEKWAKRLGVGATLVVNDLNAIFDGEYDGDTEAAIAALVASVNDQLDGDIGELEIEVDDLDNGRTKVKIKAERQDYDDYEEYDKPGRGQGGTNQRNEADDDELEVEIEVEDGQAIIEVEIDGVETSEVVDETDRYALVAYVAETYDLSTEEIEAVLEFEIDDDNDDSDDDSDEAEDDQDDGDSNATTTDSE